jgi:tetratricopeptide (TPR) repeat protein
MPQHRIVSICAAGLPATAIIVHGAMLMSQLGTANFWANYAIFHIMVAVGMAALSLLLRAAARDSLLPFQLLLIGFLSLPGAALAMIVPLIRPPLQPTIADDPILNDTVADQISFSSAILVLDREAGYRPDYAVPYQDYIEHGSVWEKQRAIATMARFFRPGYLPILRQATRDPNNAIRVHAATALARIEDDYLKRRIAHEQSYAHDATDRAIVLELAKFYENYVASGLLDDANVLTVGSEAIRLYSKALIIGYDSAIIYSLGTLWLRLNYPEQAAQCFQRVLALNPDHKAAYGHLLAAYQAARNFRQLRLRLSIKSQVIEPFTPLSLNSIQDPLQPSLASA